MKSLVFLTETLFGLYMMVILLRIWLQLARADFYNPFSQFVVKATNPLLVPLRRIIPGFAGLDVAAIILVIIVGMLKILALLLITSSPIQLLTLSIGSLMTVAKEVFSLLFWVLVIRALMSWFSQGHNPMEQVLSQLTEPMLRPIRKVVPPMGGLDLSLLLLLVGLQFINYLIIDIFGRI